jgi:hypothetical protein
LLADWAQDGWQGPAWRGVIFRQSYPELSELITRSQTLIPQCWPGSEWLAGERTWHLPTGATLRMRSLERAEDAAHYQGHGYSFIAFDELGAWPDDRAYRMLLACLRSAEPVECLRIRASANPAGPGHHWIKARFVDPAPQGYRIIRDEQTGMDRVFIPSRVQNNRILMLRDPGYVDRLKGVGSPQQVRAWLHGDWNAVVGSFYPEFGEQHIRRPFAIPRAWTRFRAFDWGSARPFACLWFAVSNGDVPNVPRGCLIAYRELYGASAPNVGLRLSVEEVADRIREHELGDDPVTYSVADPAIFTADGGPSMAERFAARKVFFKPADNERVAGWDQLRQRLRGEDDQPMIYFFNTCVNTIRTLPAQQYDPRRQEDLDSRGEDHLVDVCRYACMSRPWEAAPQPAKATQPTMDMLWQERERQRW